MQSFSFLWINSNVLFLLITMLSINLSLDNVLLMVIRMILLTLPLSSECPWSVYNVSNFCLLFFVLFLYIYLYILPFIIILPIF